METDIKVIHLTTHLFQIMEIEYKKLQNIGFVIKDDSDVLQLIDTFSEKLARSILNKHTQKEKNERQIKEVLDRKMIEDLVGENMEDMGLEGHFDE